MRDTSTIWKILLGICLKGTIENMERNFIGKLVRGIGQYTKYMDEIKIMEVCGTHTQSIAKHGIASLLPPQVKLLSGPGCPVCVTPANYIDDAIKLLVYKDIIVATFGDMMRVKGTETSLERSGSKDRKPIIVYSPFDVIEIARSNRDKMVVFLAVGFETTASAIASLVKHAEEKLINNINVMTSIRLMPPILEKVLQQHNGRLHGIICPGHVATIMGEEYFEFLPEKYRIVSVISGFDAPDILGAIYLLVQSKCESNEPELRNIYRKCVSINGNEKAKDLMGEVFKVDDGLWRGIGLVSDSALVLKEQYEKYDAVKNFNLNSWSDEISNACSCSDILMGKKEPKDCSLFGTICNPVNPYGPCMVSSEGACSIYYEYRR